MVGGDKGGFESRKRLFPVPRHISVHGRRRQGSFEGGKPYFECVGKQFCRCAGPGLGLRARLTNNLILSNIMQAFTEGLSLSTKAGADPDLVLGILDNSASRTGCITFETNLFSTTKPPPAAPLCG
jgi:3-hydroxyisobutyrate dehydrogenase-like beta-hydroxyacid dehydrogenase